MRTGGCSTTRQNFKCRVVSFDETLPNGQCAVEHIKENLESTRRKRNRIQAKQTRMRKKFLVDQVGCGEGVHPEASRIKPLTSENYCLLHPDCQTNKMIEKLEEQNRQLGEYIEKLGAR